MKTKQFLSLWLISLGISGLCRAQKEAVTSRTDVVKLDFSVLAASKNRVKANDPALRPAFEQLLKEGDALLQVKPVSVMDKTDMPPSGNKHDYMSIAPYWWPDPSKPGGVPYIRKDGEINPEGRNYSDKANLVAVCQQVYTLSLAYYFSGKEAYARQAGKLIDVWFLDSATAMNPNINYGQAIKGITEGRGEGMIEARHFIFLLDGVELLKTSEHFNESRQKKLVGWFKSFLNWMHTSPVAKDEMEAKNNHGVWFDATRLAIALFVGDKAIAQVAVQSAIERLDTQMDENGYFPLELARTTSMNYSCFVLEAFTIIAQLSEKTGTSFWTVQTRTGKSLEKAYATLFPHLIDEKPWTWKQIKPFKLSSAYLMLWRGASKYNCTACPDAIKKNEKEPGKMLINLL